MMNWLVFTLLLQAPFFLSFFQVLAEPIVNELSSPLYRLMMIEVMSFRLFVFFYFVMSSPAGFIGEFMAKSSFVYSIIGSRVVGATL